MSEFTTRDQVAAKLREIFDDLLPPGGADPIHDGSRLVEDLRADSLDLVELLIFAEEAFGIEISDAELEHADTFGQFVDLICGKLNIGVAA